MNHILYYPGILIPNDWIKQTILYSDKISSIYPYDFGNIEGEEEKFAFTNMQYLKSLDLYEYTHPEDIDEKTHSLIFNDLRNLLSENALEGLRNDYTTYRRNYQIYLSKMNDDICRYLVDNKVAKFDVHFPNSILVEVNVGLLYMSILAFHSTRDKANYTTSTDEVDHQNLLFESIPTRDNDFIHKLILNEIPTISPHTSIEQIISFKETRSNELIEFRNFLNEWLEEIQKDISVLSKFKEDFDRYSLEIRNLINDSGLSVTGNTLEVIIPPLAVVATRHFNNMLDESTIMDAVSATSATFAVSKIKSRITRNKTIKNNPLSYLFYVKKNFK